MRSVAGTADRHEGRESRVTCEGSPTALPPAVGEPPSNDLARQHSRFREDSLAASHLYGVFTAASWILLVKALKTIRPTAALVILAAEVPLVPLRAALVTGVFPNIQVVIGGTMVLTASLGLSFATMKNHKSD